MPVSPACSSGIPVDIGSASERPRIVEALIAEARAGVIPGADAVSAREACGILPLVWQIAQFRDDEGAAAKAEHRAGGKRKDLVGAVAPARVPAEHGGLKRYIIARLDPNANAGSGQRIGRSPAGKIGGKNIGQLMPLLMK